MVPQHAHEHSCLWTCPLCQEALQLQAAHYRCRNGHVFDRAKEGYVNLLPANRKRSASPGDSKAMLRGRRAFLEQGHYRPLAERLGALCREHSGDCRGDLFALLDAGCGEGYYTGHIADALLDMTQRPGLWLGGIDIAKDAARMAAKRHRQVQFAVASNAHIPLAERSLDCALCIFAPTVQQEIRRVLKSHGLFIRVSPGERHLFQLRRLVYDRPREHQAPESPISGLTHVRREALDYRLHLQGPGVAASLLAMTPYYWQASREKQAMIGQLDDVVTEVAFRIDCYRASRSD
jgi:23S rRNA (guanine745-N1)-methyltransferase